MFTEQPTAPPQPPAQVQPASVTAQPTPPPAPTSSPVSAPELSAPQSTTPSVAPAPPESAQSTTPKPASTSAPSAPSKAAIAQRRQEVEQLLIDLTKKSQAAQREKQELQAATEAAKYSQTGDFEAARQAASNPDLPEALRQALLESIRAKETQKTGKTTASAPTQPHRATASATGRIAPPEASALNPRYSTQPLLLFNQAELQERLRKLAGRGILNFIFPLTIPAPVTSAFGWRIHPISGSNRFHQGIDLGAPYGSPVVSAKAGRVEAADYLDGYGLTVVIRHADGQQTLYAHLSGVYVKPGDVVKQGHLIGLVGSTGNSTGPHLHFELHELTAGEWVAMDPAFVLDTAIAFARRNPANLASRKPQSFNLAASGLLDLNAPSPVNLLPPGQTLLSQLLNPSSANSASILIPFAMLPPALPEIGWLISPLVDDFLTEELSLSADGSTLPTTVTFSTIPALTETPEPIAFKPLDQAITGPTTVTIASTPLAQLLNSVAQTASFQLNLQRMEALLSEPLAGSAWPVPPSVPPTLKPPAPKPALSTTVSLPPTISDRRLPSSNRN